MNKILLLVPAKTARGGITNYFYTLKDKFSLPVVYVLRGARTWPYRGGILSETYRLILDMLVFIKELMFGKVSLIQTSTSLGGYAVIRDGLFLLIASFFNVKKIVFFRGWKLDFEKKINDKYLRIFRFVFFKADRMIVLSSSFKKKLVEWGYKGEIHIESTIVDENLIKNYIFKRNPNYLRSKKVEILFLSRVEKEKGIYEAVKTILLLSKWNEGLNITFKIAGDGKELENVKQFVLKERMTNVVFLGHIQGQIKADVLTKADIFLFPSYTEGMPNSVLEAMAFGLPVITREVGAIPDIINNGENGFYTHLKDPEIFANYIQRLIDNPQLNNKISYNNHTKALSNYTTTEVLKRIENIYIDTINETTNSAT